MFEKTEKPSRVFVDDVAQALTTKAQLSRVSAAINDTPSHLACNDSEHELEYSEAT